MSPGARVVLDKTGLSGLLDALWGRGYQVVGPVVHDGAIVLDEVRSVHDLPVGWRDEQDGGTYRLRRRDDGAVFAHAAGPQSWRKYLSPPRSLVWRASLDDGDFAVVDRVVDEARYAFIGVRACDLRAMEIQDRVCATGPHPDPGYVARRSAAFVVAVNCTEPGGTCFCTSMGSGPRADAGFDLALTEVLDGGQRFVVAIGSEAGALLIAEVAHRPADDVEAAEAAALVERAAGRMGRTMAAGGLQELLAGSLEHPRWEEVASRCLSCANCTLVCPTCFCSTVEDVTDLTGEHAERWRRWDSCFTADFSYLHGGTVRNSTRSRYRQWLTHKLGTWHDQFGTSGCVGCGRCITWCPVGIDLTEEVAALRAPAGTDEG